MGALVTNAGLTRWQRSWALTLMLLVFSTHSLAGNYDSLIQELFPKATRIGEQLSDFPVIPVYQLSELLGYAYQSNDLSDLPGFSGKPIKLLIGLDTQGRFTGVRILSHHEPVFLHGLGQKPLFDFVAQYRGRSLTENIIVNSNKQSDGSGGGPVYIDGVSKATVSVIIVNDSILSSALQVARSKLEGFAQQPAARPRQDLYQPLDWQQLLQRGLVNHWRLDRETLETAFGQALENYPELDAADPEAGLGDLFSDIYYAYLNAPIIGRNLLGDEAYANLISMLKPGEQVFAVMSAGLYPHVADDFKPGTVPSRLGLEQNKLAIELRDLNILNDDRPFQAAGIPEFPYAHLLRIKGNAGFDPASAARFKLNVELKRNHLIADRGSFSAPYQLPAELFEWVEDTQVEAPAPIWLMLWQDRLLQIGVLLTSLLVLTWVFVRQHHVSRQPWFHGFRWAYLWFTLLFIGFYAQGQLSVVNIYTLLLAISDGFDIRMFLLDPVIFILWCFTFVSLLLWGRGLFCGWLCPFGALQEMIAWVAKRLRIRQWKIAENRHRQLVLLKYPLLIGLVGVSFYSLTLAEQLAEVEPFKTSITLGFDRHWPFVLYALALLGLGLFVHKFYCRYLCPLGAGLAIIGRLRRFHWLKRIELCGSPCQLCKRRCEINAIHANGDIDYDECIQCLECIVIVNDENQCVASLQQAKQQRRQQNNPQPYAAIPLQSQE